MDKNYDVLLVYFKKVITVKLLWCKRKNIPHDFLFLENNPFLDSNSQPSLIIFSMSGQVLFITYYSIINYSWINADQITFWEPFM